MSFSEMMESGRGPGVIGMLLALVVIAIFAMLFIFAFDEKFQGGGKSIESMIADQAMEIADLTETKSITERQLTEAKGRQALNNELAALKRESQNLTTQIEGIESEINGARGNVAALILEFETYKDSYRSFVRNKAKGLSIERLVTTKGDIYENVTIREITAIGAQVRHDGGLKRIPYEELPLEMQDYYQFDAGQKTDALALEKEIRNRHESDVEAALDAARKNARTQQLAGQTETARNAIRDLVALDARIARLDKEIMGMKAAIDAEEAKKARKYSGTVGGISRAPDIRLAMGKKQQELYELKKQANVLRARVSP